MRSKNNNTINNYELWKLLFGEMVLRSESRIIDEMKMEEELNMVLENTDLSSSINLEDKYPMADVYEMAYQEDVLMKIPDLNGCGRSLVILLRDDATKMMAEYPLEVTSFISQICDNLFIDKNVILKRTKWIIIKLCSFYKLLIM